MAKGTAEQMFVHSTKRKNKNKNIRPFAVILHCTVYFYHTVTYCNYYKLQHLTLISEDFGTQVNHHACSTNSLSLNTLGLSHISVLVLTSKLPTTTFE